jgi:hypothetical protein
MAVATLQRRELEHLGSVATAQRRWSAVVNRLPRTEEGLADLGVALRDALGSDGEALAQG